MTNNSTNQTAARQIKIFDTTLRDGEQAPGATLTPEEKIAIAMQLEKLGIDVIEPGFPISSPGDFAAVQQISRALQHVEICGFARAVKEDIDAAVAATMDAQRRRIHLFISSSDIHLDHQLRKSREQVIGIAREMVAYAKQFVDCIEFTAMDSTRSGEEFVYEMIEAVIAEGANIINLPDTVGYALPEEYGRLFRNVRANVRGGNTVEYSAHCHNDLGLAVANSLAAIQAGATQIEVTLNGVGERAGNCSLEELVMAIETRKDALGVMTGIRTEEIYPTSRMVSRAMHFPIAFNKPIVGRNAFQHESGIHQDGLLKNRNTYEIMNPEQMGIPRKMIILGKHSGRHAIKHRIVSLGMQVDESQLEAVYHRFKEKADVQKVVTDDELIELVGAATDYKVEAYSLVDVQVMSNSGRERVASTQVMNHWTGETMNYSATGQGPVEAVLNCVKQAYPFSIELVDMELHSMNNGESAKGEAEVTIRVEEVEYRGSGMDQDVIIAVAKAYVAACNQAMREKSNVNRDNLM